jgi:hypothetical protein
MVSQSSVPASPATYSPVVVYNFTSSWTDNVNISSAVLEFNGANVTAIQSGSGFVVGLAGLAAGSYSCKWFANDTSNNVNSSAVFNYSVVPAASFLELSVLPSGTVSFGTNTTVLCNASASQITPVLTRNSSVVSNPDTAVLVPGSYNYSCTAAASGNYSVPVPVSAILTVVPAQSSAGLFLNGFDSDIVVPENSTVNITGLLLNGTGTIDLFVNGSLINSGSSPLVNSTFFGASGVYPALVNYSGNSNFTPASAAHFVIVGSGLAKFNFAPPGGSLLNQSFVQFSMSTNLNTTCRWDFNDLAYSGMANAFSSTGLTLHNTTINGLRLGLNTFSAGCVNDTPATNADITYNVTNIIENSDIDAALIDNSIVRFVNISPATIITNSNLSTVSVANSGLDYVSVTGSSITNSTLAGCLVTNSVVKNIIASGCNFADSFVDPGNLTGSNVTNSRIIDSNATFSTISGSTIMFSNLDNATVTAGSFLNNVTGSNVIISNNILSSGNVTIVTRGIAYNATAVANLTEFVEIPPTASFSLSPGSMINAGQDVVFTSTSSDLNIGTVLNDSITLFWQFSDGTNSTSAVVARNFPAIGSFPFNLTATDSFGLSDTVSGIIVVTQFTQQGGGGGGGGGRRSYGSGPANVFKYNLTRGQSRTFALGSLDAVLIDYNGIIYPLENIRIGSDHVNFTITGRQSRLTAGEVRNYNLDLDGFTDLRVAFSRNRVSRIELELGLFRSPVPGFAQSGQQPVEGQQPELPEEQEITEPVQEPARPEEAVGTVVEVSAKVTKGLLSRILDAVGSSRIAGNAVSALADGQSGSWAVAIVIIVLGLLLYFVIAELLWQ